MNLPAIHPCALCAVHARARTTTSLPLLLQLYASVAVMYGFYRGSVRLMKFFFNVSDKQIFTLGFAGGILAALIIGGSAAYAQRRLTFQVDDVYRAALRQLRKCALTCGILATAPSTCLIACACSSPSLHASGSVCVSSIACAWARQGCAPRPPHAPRAPRAPRASPPADTHGPMAGTRSSNRSSATCGGLADSAGTLSSRCGRRRPDRSAARARATSRPLRGAYR